MRAAVIEFMPSLAEQLGVNFFDEKVCLILFLPFRYGWPFKLPVGYFVAGDSLYYLVEGLRSCSTTSCSR